MENRSYALAAGLFALVMGSALFAVIWWFGDNREITRDYILVTQGNVGTLNVQAGVRFRGMVAGRVTAIRLDPEDPRNILVTISIRADLPITRGTSATLDSMGVTGIGFIQLDDFGDDLRPLVEVSGRPPRLPLEPSVITRIAEATFQALLGINTTTSYLNALLSEENRGRFADILVKLDAVADGVDQGLEEMSTTLSALQELVGPKNQARLTGLLTSFEQAGAEAVPAFQELRTLLATLEEMSELIATRVDEVGDGWRKTGDYLADDTLPRVDRLLEELSSGTRRLERLLEDIENDPRIILRGRAQPEPGPGER